MGGFGDLSLGVRVGIVLGGLVVVALIAGGIKVVLNRRRLKQKLIEEASRPADKEKLVSKEPTEGNLYGIRARNDYSGGISQRSSSPSPSYRLAPEETLIDWGKEGKPGSSASSISSVPRARMKQSPLRLELQDAKYNPSSTDGKGGSYMPPPLPSPRSNQVLSPMFNEARDDARPAGWVSPLDVHFSRPSTPGTLKGAAPTPYNRPISHLPKLNLEAGKTGTLMQPATEAQSEVASIVSSGVTTPTPALLYPTMASARTPPTPSRSVFTSEKPQATQFQTPAVPLKDLPSPTNFVDQRTFPSDNRQWRPASPSLSLPVVKAHWRNAVSTKNVVQTPTAAQRPIEYSLKEFNTQVSGTPTLPLIRDDAIDTNWNRSQPVIRNSAVMQRVSIVQPQLEGHSQLDADQRLRQIQDQLRSLETSSTHKEDSPASGSNNKLFPVRMSSHAAEIVFSQSSTTPDSQYPDTPRTHTSHDRSVSDESITRGREHNLPERDSPFSNSHATSDNSHSANSSFSSYLSDATSSPVRSHAGTNKSQTSLLDLENFPFPASPRPPQQSHGFQFALPPAPVKDTGYLQVKHNTGRPTSNQSLVSMGDFYDSYYFDEIPEPLSPTYMKERVVQNSPGNSPRHEKEREVQMQSPGNSPTKRRAPPRRPAPLNLGKMGKGFVGSEGMEVMTPTTGAFVPVGGSKDRFLSRI